MSLFFTTHQATPPAAPYPITGSPAFPTDIPGVGNFARVAPHLYRGAQPTAAGFQELKHRGIRTVIDLRGLHDDIPLLRASAPWRYFRIHEWAWHPETEDTLKVLKVMTDPANWPVFVHCHHGADRTGTSVACYRMVIQGWTNAMALNELYHFGFHKIWFDIVHYLTTFDATAARKQLAKTRQPDLRLIY